VIHLLYTTFSGTANRNKEKKEEKVWKVHFLRDRTGERSLIFSNTSSRTVFLRGEKN